MSYDQVRQGSDRIERLLERASPRPAPPPDDARQIRESVHAEWRAVTARRRRSRWSYAALAATLAACAILTARYSGTDDAMPVEVATIEKRAGSVYLVRDNEGLIELGEVANLLSGQVVQTAKVSGLAFVLDDGPSVRLDADSRVELVSSDLLYLQRGRLYVDVPGTKPPSRLAIRTDKGTVTHIGTRYMVTIAGDKLTVSVRDGEVRIDGRYNANAGTGEQVTLLGSNRPMVGRLAAHGGPWLWTESLSPKLDIDGMPAHEFLEWVSRETGYRIVYDDDDARALAGNTVLKGVVDRDPRTELELRLMTMDLAYELDDARGLIHVRSGNPR
jgi:ferric-dicitrate binding protein FerR (iron transport regulator)